MVDQHRDSAGPEDARPEGTGPDDTARPDDPPGPDDRGAEEAEAGAGATVGRRGAGLVRQWPLTVVLVGLLVSLGVVVYQDFRPGAVGLASTILLAGVLRLSLPERAAGLLAVRSRGWDVVTLFVFGIGALALAIVVPEIG